ncbi:MAG TPA: hypothetical protein PLV39_00070 [Fimbriimonadaceae bacterium]|nr:hypothetical protein [Fimbriimonadaceae bacterium]
MILGGSMSGADVPAELAPELTRLGARRIRAMRGRVGMAMSYGVPADEIMDWLIEGGCTVQLAEWIIDQARSVRSSRGDTLRHAILGDPVRVKSPLEAFANSLCAAAWLFLIAVASIAWRAIDLLVPLFGLGLVLAGIGFSRNLFELWQCAGEWLARRRANRSGSNT